MQSRHLLFCCVLLGLLGLVACGRNEPRSVVEMTGGIPEVAGGIPELGSVAMQAYGCGSCHTIPGVRRASATVGPPLGGWSRRQIIAGNLPNTPDNLMEWIMAPQAIEPGSAMPDLGVPEPDARDMASYLFRLR